MRTTFVIACCLASLGTATLAACGSSGAEDVAGCGEGCPGDGPSGSNPNGGRDGSGGGPNDPNDPNARPDDGILNGGETDIDCGGPRAPACATGKTCVEDDDCAVGACSYQGKCIDEPSCKPHLGGDTCGLGEVGEEDAKHESCCRTLPVKGFTDKAHPGKKVYLDKYEITNGRVRAFLTAMMQKHNGMPDVQAFVASKKPSYWDDAWTRYLPADIDKQEILVDRRLLGDPRGTWPGAPSVPDKDQPRKTGVDFQFNNNLFVYMHGNNCTTQSPNSWGWPSWYYPPDVLAKMGPDYPARPSATDFAGKPIAAKDFLEVKSANCITNAMLAAFCEWDGGQLATSEVLDFVTDSPPSLGNKAGCGSQVPEDPPKSDATVKGGRCAELAKINATYDAGASLPEPGSPLNRNNYVYPYYADDVTYDKAWQISAPGRGSLAADGAQVDTVRIDPKDEPWMDLAGNLSEAVLTTKDGKPNGRFGLKYRGLGYNSARSQLNLDDKWDSMGIARIERAEAKAAFTGGRCMRFK